MQVRSQEMEYDVRIWEAEKMQVWMKVTECLQVQNQEADCMQVQNQEAESNIAGQDLGDRVTMQVRIQKTDS